MRAKNKTTGESFSGQVGFVLAAAGSAVGVGNLWRFPYLAAKDGGGLFVIIYLCLVVTFGFTLLTSDISIGRKTKQSAIGAYAQMNRNWKFLGVLTFLVPVLIMTYYAVIGGWVSRYICVYFIGEQAAAAEDQFFSSFISSPVGPVVFSLIFMGLTSWIVYRGVEGGIEAASKWMMPVLLVMIVVIAVFSLTLKHTGSDGVTRTGLQGLKAYLMPDITGLTAGRFFQILLDAMSQLFFSLSVSMGIMITYGSYVKPDVNLSKSVNQIEVFDTVVALLAGLMIIPAIYVFSGVEGMNAGAGLMFVSLPKVFHAMGHPGVVIGAVFFIMVAFATLTSCISVLESIAANCMELFHASRKRVTLVLTAVYMGASVVIALGYSVFYAEVHLPNGTVGQLLDLMDYISNSVMMPFISLCSTLLIGWVVGPKWIIEEMESSGDPFRRKQLYQVMIRYVTPVMMFFLFLQSTGLLNAIH